MKHGVRRKNSSGPTGHELVAALEFHEASFDGSAPVKEKLSPGNVPELTLFINAVRDVLGLAPLPFSVSQKKGDVQRWNGW